MAIRWRGGAAAYRPLRENVGVPLYRDEAIVLRTQKLGEADRIITLLTREHGRVRAVARGVRKTSSRWGSRLEPFTHVDLQIAEGRTLDVVTQAETRAPYGSGLGGDYERYTAGTAMLETAERLASEDKQPMLQQFLLLVGGLRAMATGEHAASQVLDSYLLRSLAVAGYAPSFDHCVRCGDEGPHKWFNPSAGGVMCVDCRLPGSATPAPATVAVLGALLAGDWAVVHARRAPAPQGGQRHRRGLPRLASRAWAPLAGLRRALSARRRLTPVRRASASPRRTPRGRRRRRSPGRWCPSTSRS